MNRIKEIRESSGIRQVDLRSRLGWSQGRLGNYESGLRVVGLAEAREIVSALNALGVKCDLDSVFPESEMSAA